MTEIFQCEEYKQIHNIICSKYNSIKDFIVELFIICLQKRNIALDEKWILKLRAKLDMITQSKELTRTLSERLEEMNPVMNNPLYKEIIDVIFYILEPFISKGDLTTFIIALLNTLEEIL